MRTRDIAPGLAAHRDDLTLAAEYVAHQNRSVVDALAGGIVTLMEARAPNSPTIDRELVALRLVSEVLKVSRASLTWHVATAQSHGYLNVQIAAALGLASSSNVAGRFQTASIRRMLSDISEGAPGSVVVDGYNFRIDRQSALAQRGRPGDGGWCVE